MAILDSHRFSHSYGVMMQSPSEMKIFVEVACQSGFTAAARELNVSKSHVSKQIRGLEERLGVRLLHRTTREVSLTEAGEVYFRHCQRILGDIEEAERAVSELRSSPRGMLRITAPMTFGVKWLNGLLCEYLQRHSELDAEVFYTDEFVGLLEANVDAAVRIGELKDSSLIGRRLAPVELVTVASPAYLDAYGEPTNPDELRDHSCLRYSYQLGGTTWQYRRGGEEIHVPVEGRVTANNGQALAQAARAGLGIDLAPDFIVAEYVEAGELVPLLTDWKSRELALWVVYPDRQFLPRKVRLFVDFLADEFADGAPWALSTGE